MGIRDRQMNKHSKYRKLLDDVKDQVCNAEIGVTGVYQLMLETLHKAEKEEEALQAHIVSLRNAIAGPSAYLDSNKMNTLGRDCVYHQIMKEALENTEPPTL